MRTRLALSVLMLLVLGFGLLPTVEAQNEKKEKLEAPNQKKERVEAPVEKRERPSDAFTIADRLQTRVSIQNDIPESPLSEALEFLNDHFKLNIEVDHHFGGGDGAVRFQNAEDKRLVHHRLGENPVLNERVSIRKVSNVKLETVLRSVCKQVNAYYLIHSDQILLVSMGQVVNMISEAEENPLPVAFPLVTMKVEKKPLKAALEELSERSNTTILLAPQSEEAAKLEVSFKLLNTPIDRAVGLLAEIGELRSVRRGNAYLVTSVAKAKALNPDTPEMGLQGVQPAFLNGFPQGLKLLRRDELSTKIDELTQKIAELEKKLNEKK